VFGFNPYLLGGVAFAFAALVGFGMVQTARLGGCQDSLSASRLEVKLLRSSVEAQNRAVDDLKTESGRRLKEGEAALSRARGESAKARGVAALLRSEATKVREPEQPKPAGTCPTSPAERAVRRIRELL
jgi:hypothetical protein